MRDPDAEIELHLLATALGGRVRPVATGYRGAHLVREGYLTSGEIVLTDREWLMPGDSAPALVTYVSPEAYPACLWVGKTMPVQEGGRVVGSATIRRVLNPVLEAPAN